MSNGLWIDTEKIVVSELRKFEMFNDMEKDFSPKPVAFCGGLLSVL